MKFFIFYQMNFREFLKLFRAGREGQGKEIEVAKISVRPRKNTAEGGCGGNSAVFLQKIEASPAALLVESRSQQKSFLFLLEEIGRAQIRKSKENFFVGWRASARSGGLASLVSFKVGSRKVYNYSTKLI
jgi:xanthine/CO dehydrogenase XdhC/CoxF family maturation factor